MKINIVTRVINKTRKVLYNKFFKKYKVKKLTNRIKNKDISLITFNCIGGILYNEMSLRFNSPTINMFFSAPDFIKFCTNLKYYMEKELIEDTTADSSYPVAKIDDIKIFGLHYKSFDELKTKWDERKQRINWDNIFIIGGYRDNCTPQLVEEFGKIPFDNKIMLIPKGIKKYPYTRTVKSLLWGKQELAPADAMKNCFGKRYYDTAIDFVDWFNNPSKYR